MEINFRIICKLPKKSTWDPFIWQVQNTTYLRALILRCAINAGCPNDLTTYSLVSSLWTSSFALGAFVGPTAAGLLYDKVGFSWSTLFPIGFNVAVALGTLVGLLFKYYGETRRRFRQEGYR